MATHSIVVFFVTLFLPCYIANEDFVSIFPFLRVYGNGTVQREEFLLSTPFGKLVPPSLHDPQTGVSSKDIIVNSTTQVSARLYLPELSNPEEKIPVLLYFHGGGFCVGSASSRGDHTYLNRLSSLGNVFVISINYRLAPEHLSPTAYIDAWSALKWLASHEKGGVEPWLVNHGNFSRIFVGGDSAGGNIVHNLVMWAGRENLPNGINILGALLVTPYFLGSQPVKFEPNNFTETSVYKVWKYVCPSCRAGVDDPQINPLAPGAPSLTCLQCKKMIIYVAEQDVELRARGIWYYEGVKASGWKGELQIFEAEESGHVFPIFQANHPETLTFFQRVVEFLKN
ncbi:hypothetical protein Nepgr_015674 [Nepenthes gracilis]|uniref:Alpha/beta hydrolase fold-3 domain-containing protein n=1 Tax=Nepenthes gracilis TaxID=150966 RepID=A0AAD3SLG6_NEPGR|nr:hypothetical protein Nepgr_015674 [Nepenthes gracilis]